MKWSGLYWSDVQILEVNYSYDKNLVNQENFINLVLQIEKRLRLYKIQKLFKTVLKTFCNTKNSTPYIGKGNSNFSYSWTW